MARTRTQPPTPPARRALAPRVEHLERKVDQLADGHDELAARQTRLERVTAQLRRDQRETRKLVAELHDTVRGIPAAVKSDLDRQTDAIEVIVAKSEVRNADRITGVARQWPAGAIILITAVLALVAGVGVDLILAAFHQPHL